MDANKGTITMVVSRITREEKEAAIVAAEKGTANEDVNEDNSTDPVSM